MEIAHLTSAHPRYDNRIFLKECRSLAAAGHSVTLIVADGGEEETLDGVRIVAVARAKGRLSRFVGAARSVVDAAEQLAPDAYHLHDPELLPFARRLGRKGAQVFFDAHEDLPAQLLSKSYIPEWARRPASWAADAFERRVVRHLAGVFAATPSIRDKFLGMRARAVDINNYPALHEVSPLLDWANKAPECCYIGAISEKRGILPLVKSFADSPVRLNLVGAFTDPAAKARAVALRGWDRVNEHGQLGRDRAQEVLGRSVAGIVTFLPEPNHVNAQPNKMFEYMAAGVPVVASNFPLWRDIIEGSGCGICVNPSDSDAIAAAIQRLVENPDDARRMGLNGRAAVMSKYNWDQERVKLFSVYSSRLSG